MNKTIILCADDFSQNEAASFGIIELLKLKRLSAVSCMVTSSEWDNHADLLKPYPEQIDIGLHFNLTEGETCTPFFNSQGQTPTLNKLMVQAFLGKLKQQDIKAEFNAQLDKFIAKTQELPDFIDGHQHIHHLPVIRDAILAVYKSRLIKKRPYLRIAGNPFFKTLLNSTMIPKAYVIMLTGALTLKKKCKQLDIPHNQNFAGIYHFPHAKNYQKHFQSFLKNAPDRTLIMCHPGLASTNFRDPLCQSRFHEYQYLMSDAFVADCHQQRMILGRFGNEMTLL